MIQCTLPQPARNAVSSILQVFICNPFVNANTLVLLKIILEIVLIMRILALDCKRLLFLFVELWVAIKESSGPILADLRRRYEGIRMRLCNNVVCGRTNHRKFSWNTLLIEPLNTISDCLLALACNLTPCWWVIASSFEAPPRSLRCTVFWIYSCRSRGVGVITVMWRVNSLTNSILS